MSHGELNIASVRVAWQCAAGGVGGGGDGPGPQGRSHWVKLRHVAGDWSRPALYHSKGKLVVSFGGLTVIETPVSVTSLFGGSKYDPRRVWLGVQSLSSSFSSSSAILADSGELKEGTEGKERGGGERGIRC